MEGEVVATREQFEAVLKLKDELSAKVREVEKSCRRLNTSTLYSRKALNKLFRSLRKSGKINKQAQAELERGLEAIREQAEADGRRVE